VESTLIAGSVTILEGDGGTYGTIGSPLTSQINVPSAVTLEGDPAQARPVIHSNVSGNAGIDTLSTTAVVSDVDIEYTGNESAIDGPGTFNRVIANVPSGAARRLHLLNGATLTDSICSGEYGLYDAVGGSSVPWDFTLRNDTIYGSTTAVTLNAGGPLLAVTISNSIIRSAAGADLIVEESSGSAAATLDHSNYGVCNSAVAQPRRPPAARRTRLRRRRSSMSRPTTSTRWLARRRSMLVATAPPMALSISTVTHATSALIPTSARTSS